MSDAYKETATMLSQRFPHLFRAGGVERLCERVDAALDDQERQSRLSRRSHTLRT